MLKRFIFFFWLQLFVGLQSFAQTIYLHTDRTIYAAGDTIWFKAYLFDAQSWLPAPNQTFYVQLIDSQQQIHKKTLFAKNGMTDNFIALSSKLNGTYQLVAYTKAQLASANFPYRKQIIVSKYSLFASSLPVDSTAIDVQFLPEGGHLVANLPAMIAFVATDNKGMPIAIEGSIFNQNQEEITSFKTDFKGMGLLSFTPQKEQNYFAKVIFQQKSYLLKLPAIKQQGVVMKLNTPEKDSVLTLRVFQNYENPKPLEINISARGNRYFSKLISPKSTSILKIPKNNLPAGVLQFSIRQDSTVLLERLACIHRQSGLQFTVKSDSLKKSKNQKIDLDIQANNSETALSVSITDADQAESTSFSETLQSHIFLQADLRGYIQEPAYYFDTSQINSYKHLDLLLLTHGWRKYRWNGEQAPTNIELLPSIEGITTTYKTDKGVENTKITYHYGSTFGQTFTDKKGLFRIEEDLNEGTPLYLQARKKNDNLFDIKLINRLDSLVFIPFPTQLIMNKNTNNEVFAIEKPVYNENTIELAEISIKAKRNAEAIDKITNGIALDINSGINLALQTKLEFTNDMPDVNSLLELITKKVQNVAITSNYIDGEFIQILTTPGGPIKPVVIFKNNSFQCYYCKHSFIENLANPHDIAHILYFTPNYESSGALVLITKDAIPNYDFSKDKTVGSLVVKNVGFSPSKAFYVPKFEAQNLDKQVDKRATFYWNPTITTDANGKASISFYNSGIAKRLLITIEGMDGKGKVGSFKRVMD